MAATSREFALNISEQERELLINLVEQAIQDTHDEARRTEAPNYQQVIHKQETLLRGLLAKVQGSDS